MAAEVAAAWVAIVVTLGVAIVGWARANRADATAKRATTAAEKSAEAAERSASEATRANELTREANERAAHADVRATTRNDVHWESRAHGTSWTITNKGVDDAHDVVVIIRVDDSTSYERIDVGHVPGLASAVVRDIQGLRTAKATDNAAVVRSMSGSGVAYFPSYSITAHQRILWKDAAGTSHTTDEEKHDLGG